MGGARRILRDAQLDWPDTGVCTMAAWLQQRCDWEASHPTAHQQWMLAFVLWGLEQLGICLLYTSDAADDMQ
eukprot:9397519-Prorocentrum_lima.AAC.1